MHAQDALAKAMSQASRGQVGLPSVGQGRIASIEADGVRIVVTGQSRKVHIGPCILPIGLLGVGPATITGDCAVSVQGTATALVTGTAAGTESGVAGTVLESNVTGEISNVTVVAQGTGPIEGTVNFTNATELKVGQLVLAVFPPGAMPWIVAVAPNTGGAQ